MTFIECAGAPADCADPQLAPVRSVARRLLYADREPGPALREAARSVVARLPDTVGRVESAGSFEDAAISAELAAALPANLVRALSPRLEWYGCRGAFFHNDAHYVGVLFGVWCLAGPNRQLIFPRVDRRLPAKPGSLAVFDPFEPHAVLVAGASRYSRDDYAGSEPSLFLGFEVRLEEDTRAIFGIGPPSTGSAANVVLSSRLAVNAETGALDALADGPNTPP